MVTPPCNFLAMLNSSIATLAMSSHCLHLSGHICIDLMPTDYTSCLQWTPSNLDPWNEATPVLRPLQNVPRDANPPLKWGHPSNQDTLTGVARLEGVHCIANVWYSAMRFAYYIIRHYWLESELMSSLEALQDTELNSGCWKCWCT